jgi:DNA-binding protein HU-beta
LGYLECKTLPLLTNTGNFQQKRKKTRVNTCFHRISSYTFVDRQGKSCHQTSNNLYIMNKAELIDAMAANAKISKADAKKALDAFIETTTKALKKDDRVALVGFGSFSTSKRAARKGRNPQTGKEIQIKAKKVVRFKAGAELSTKVK